MSVVSQLWQTPVRHDQRTGTSHASASSSRLRVVVAPRDGEVAAGELDRRAVPGWPAGGCGGRAGVAAMPGVRPGAGPNGSVWMRAASRPSAARPALISSMNGAGPQRYASASRGGSSSASSDGGEPARAVEVAALDVVGAGAAVADVACARSGATASSARASAANGVVAAAARAVQPPDLALGVLLRQRVQHGEHRRGADAGADQQHRRVGVGVEDEGAARRGDLEPVADARGGVCR